MSSAKTNLTYFLGLKQDTPTNVVYQIAQSRLENYESVLEKDPHDPHVTYIRYQLLRLYRRYCTTDGAKPLVPKISK